MISNLSTTSRIKVSNLDLDKNDTYFKLEDLEITPSGVEQEFKSNKYGYDNVTIKAVESQELNIVPSTETQVNEALYNKVTVIGDENLVPENIKDNISIFGVNGTAKTTNAKIADVSYLFYNNARLDSINDFLRLCENVTDMSHMFYGCDELIELDLSNFDTSNVINMDYMFYGCDELAELDLSNFDTSNVTKTTYMFSSCTDLTELNVSSFNTINTIYMNSMFRDCSKLTELNVKNFNTSNAINVSRMFEGCKNISELDLSSFDFSKVTNIQYIFNSCTNLLTIHSFKNFGKAFTSKTTNLSVYTISFNTNSNISHESLVDVITNGLYDLNLTYDVANGGTLYPQKLQLGSTNLAKLSPEEIAIATNKGWAVS